MGNTKENTLNERVWWPVAVHARKKADMLKSNELHKAIPSFEKRFQELEEKVEALAKSMLDLTEALEEVLHGEIRNTEKNHVETDDAAAEVQK